MVKEIEKYDVLAPMDFKISKGAATKVIKGFRSINFKKVLELDDQVLVKWVRNGVMGMIYAHLNSLSNLRTLIKMQGIKRGEHIDGREHIIRGIKKGILNSIKASMERRLPPATPLSVL